MAPQASQFYPSDRHESRPFSEDSLGKYKIKIVGVVLHVKWFDKWKTQITGENVGQWRNHASRYKGPGPGPGPVPLLIAPSPMSVVVKTLLTATYSRVRSDFDIRAT